MLPFKVAHFKEIKGTLPELGTIVRADRVKAVNTSEFNRQLHSVLVTANCKHDPSGPYLKLQLICAKVTQLSP